MARGPLSDHLGEVTTILNRGAVGLLLDLDGTLSEIVPGSDAATVSPTIRTALIELQARLALVAIVTGRSALKAREIVGIAELVYVGNHGLETLEKGRFDVAEEARASAPFLGRMLTCLRHRFPSAGLFFEHKGGSFAVHYRHAGDPEKAREDVLEAIQELAAGEVRVVMGKTVINVLPPVDLNKGTAAVSLVDKFALAGAVAIGDDVTDIDLLRAVSQMSRDREFSSLSIAVVSKDSPPELEMEADFTVSDVAEVEGLLTWLVEQTA